MAGIIILLGNAMMYSFTCSAHVFVICLVSLSFQCQLADAQIGANKTILTIEIMLPRIVGDPVQAQRWGKVFSEMGETARIRQPLPSDKPEIKETKRGTFRIIRVIGELDRKGDLVFPQKTFSIKQTDQIKTWLNELKVYGAQGSPDGKKFWGLNKQQFDDVVKALSVPIAKETKEEQLMEVIDALPIDKTYSVIVHPEAREAFFKIETAELRQELKKVSSGTALAILLRERGFGFRPLRTPSASIELTIQSLSKISDPWPVGWDIGDTRPRNLIMPNLFEFVKTGFEEAPLQRVLDAISEQTKTSILIDHSLCKKKEIDLSKAAVSYPEKQTAWSLVLASVVRQARLTHKIMLDEAGRPFVWVAPFVPFQLKNR